MWWFLCIAELWVCVLDSSEGCVWAQRPHVGRRRLQRRYREDLQSGVGRNGAETTTSACVCVCVAVLTLRWERVCETRCPVSDRLCVYVHYMHVCVCVGHVLLSGGRDGLITVSSPVTGVTVRTISDHKGAPITTVQCTSKQVCACVCVCVLVFLFCKANDSTLCMMWNCGPYPKSIWTLKSQIMNFIQRH